MKTKPAIIAFIVLVFAVFSNGCATATISQGRQFDLSRVTSIQKGVTTKAEIVAWFGAPYSTSVAADGAETLVYWVANTKSHAQSYVVSMKVQAETTHKRLTVTLRDGTVSDFAYSEGAGNGLAAAASL